MHTLFCLGSLKGRDHFRNLDIVCVCVVVVVVVVVVVLKWVLE